MQQFLNTRRADSRFAPSRWEMALHCNDVSHWLDASLESALTRTVPPLVNGIIATPQVDPINKGCNYTSMHWIHLKRGPVVLNWIKDTMSVLKMCCAFENRLNYSFSDWRCLNFPLLKLLTDIVLLHRFWLADSKTTIKSVAALKWPSISSNWIESVVNIVVTPATDNL